MEKGFVLLDVWMEYLRIFTECLVSIQVYSAHSTTTSPKKNIYLTPTKFGNKYANTIKNSIYQCIRIHAVAAHLVTQGANFQVKRFSLSPDLGTGHPRISPTNMELYGQEIQPTNPLLTWMQPWFSLPLTLWVSRHFKQFVKAVWLFREV